MTDWTGIALVISAAAAGFVAIYTVIVTNRKVKKIGATADETLVQATEINHAVNGKAPGEASISQDIITIKEKQEFDVPTLPATPEPNGRRAVLPMMEYLTTTIEELKASIDELRSGNQAIGD